MTVSQIALVAVVLAVVLVAVAMPLRSRRAGHAERAHHHDDRLPQGADAALWSIVEAMPDPRNHLALTRDLTGEVRLTDGTHSLSEMLARGSATAGGPLRARS